MIKHTLITLVAGSTLTGLTTVAAPAGADTRRITVSVPTIRLPRGGAAARDVVATVTVDREVRWSASVSVYSYGGFDLAGHVFDVPVPPGQELLEPGVNRLVLGTTDTIDSPGPQQVTVTAEDPATGVELSRATSVVKVLGHLARPRIRHLRVDRHHVVLRGRIDRNVPDLRLAVTGHRLGAATFRRLAKVRLRPIRGRWTARLRLRRPTRVRVKATSAYGQATVSRTVTVRPSPVSTPAARRWPA